MLFTFEWNSKGFNIKTALSRSFFVLFASVAIHGKWKDPCWCVLVGFRRCSFSEAQLIFFKTGDAGFASCTVAGRFFMLLVLAQKPFYYMVSGQGQGSAFFVRDTRKVRSDYRRPPRPRLRKRLSL